MLPYLFIFFLISLLLILSSQIKTNIFFYTSFFVLVLFSGLRMSVGMDYEMYNQMFRYIHENTQPFNYEPFNMYLIQLLGSLGVQNQFIFFVYAFLTLSGVFYFIYKLSPSKELSLFIFFTIGIFYLSTFNAIRQWLAIAIILVSIVKLIEKKYIQTFIFSIIALLFHFSALFVIITFPLLSYRYKLKNVILFTIFFLLLAKAMVTILLLTKYGGYLAPIFGQKNNVFFVIFNIGVMLFLLNYFKYFNQKKDVDRDIIVFSNMNMIFILIILLGTILQIDDLSIMRMALYFEIQILVLIPLFVTKIKNVQIKALSLLLIIILSTSYFVNLLYTKGELYRLTPYQMNLKLL